jgi:hypothetical protein
MSQLATIPDTTAPPPRQRDFPPTAPVGFFADRPPSWRSNACAAGSHHFDVSAEGQTAVADHLKVLTTSLTVSRGPHRTTHYRVLRRNHRHVPYALYHDNTRLLLARTPQAVVGFLGWHINRQMIDKTCADHVVVHAAAATRAGITVILPGGQEHGKTTTVGGLLRGGYDYVTDEAVVIDPDSRWINPFPKALSIDEGSWPLFPECRPASQEGWPQWQVRAEQLGARSIRTPVLPPRIIVFPRYQAGSPTVVAELSAGDAVRELVGTTFRFADNPRRNLAVLAALVQGSTVARLQIGNLEDAVLAIDMILSETLIRALR